jgi:hypothetical protein
MAEMQGVISSILFSLNCRKYKDNRYGKSLFTMI